VSITSLSAWPWIDRAVSGLLPATDRPVKTRFPYGSPRRLASPLKVTRWPIIQKVRHHPLRGSDCLYAYGFRFYFTPLTGVLFAFPSRYWFTIGRSVVFSLGGWSPHVQTGFHVPRLTHFHRTSPFEYRAITFYGRTFQTVFLELARLLG